MNTKIKSEKFITLEMLKERHNTYSILNNNDNIFPNIVDDFPEELLIVWKSYISERNIFIDMLKKYKFKL